MCVDILEFIYLPYHIMHCDEAAVLGKILGKCSKLSYQLLYIETTLVYYSYGFR